jgi:hypothetical protein
LKKGDWSGMTPIFSLNGGRYNFRKVLASLALRDLLFKDKAFQFTKSTPRTKDA